MDSWSDPKSGKSVRTEDNIVHLVVDQHLAKEFSSDKGKWYGTACKGKWPMRFIGPLSELKEEPPTCFYCALRQGADWYEGDL